MKFETIKSVILTFLVLVSIVLTWTLWTYSPKYDQFENSDSFVEVPVINKKDNAGLIKPARIIFHKSNGHFGTIEETEINKLMKEVRKWEIYDIQSKRMTIRKEDYIAQLDDRGHVEIQFTDEIPLSLFATILQMDKREYPAVYFDRLFFNVNATGENEGIIHFVSKNNQVVYEGRVDGENVSSFERNYYHLSSHYPRYKSYTVSEYKKFYLPLDNPKISRIQYYTDTVEPDMFINALFTNPNFVKKDEFSYGDVFTDGYKILRVDQNNKLIRYVNPMGREENRLATEELIQKSIDFVNDHNGWTDRYRFFSWDKFQHRTLFRLYVKNIPVFNTNDLAEIEQIWGKNEVSRYERPLLTLQLPVEIADVALPSGDEVVRTIKAKQNIAFEMVQDISIGYELKEDPSSSKVILLDPVWTYLYDGDWKILDFTHNDELGGNGSGLE